jgi:thymidylate synthase (FAD)
MKNPWNPELPSPEPNEPNLIKIQEHKFVRLERIDGQDSDVCRAARVSYGKHMGKEIDGVFVPHTDADNQALINRLVRNRHTSPVEQVGLVFHISAELFTRSQLVRTRTAKWNEQSGRYTEFEDKFYTPDALRNQLPPGGDKQATVPGFQPVPGGHGESHLIEDITYQNSNARVAYKHLIDNGVAKEQARMVLPQTLITQWYMNIDCHNLMRMLALRCDWHAQKEVRDVANAMLYFFSREFPMLYSAWLDYIWRASSFSGQATQIIRKMLADLSLEIGVTDRAGFEGKIISQYFAGFRGDELITIRNQLMPNYGD